MRPFNAPLPSPTLPASAHRGRSATPVALVRGMAPSRPSAAYSEGSLEIEDGMRGMMMGHWHMSDNRLRLVRGARVHGCQCMAV